MLAMVIKHKLIPSVLKDSNKISSLIIIFNKREFPSRPVIEKKKRFKLMEIFYPFEILFYF